MNILVTGHLGFVGRETMNLLEEMGYTVIGYDVMEGRDIRDYAQLESVVQKEGISRILHLAAIARFSEARDNPWLAQMTNVRGTENVAMVAAKYHLPLVYASTGSVYMPIHREPPITEDFQTEGNSAYGTSKQLGELVVKRTGNPYITLRYAHLYGKEKRLHGLIGGFLERIERGLAPTLYGGKQSNDFTYIKDVARANCLALTAPWDKWNNSYNIGTGEEITTEEAGNIVCELAGYKGKIEKVPGREVDPPRFVYDTSKAENMLNFKAYYSFREGLKDMFNDYKNEASL